MGPPFGDERQITKFGRRNPAPSKGGVPDTPTFPPQTDPHDTLIVLRYVSWGLFFLKKKSLGVESFRSYRPVPFALAQRFSVLLPCICVQYHRVALVDTVSRYASCIFACAAGNMWRCWQTEKNPQARCQATYH